MNSKEAFEQWWYASKYCQVANGMNKQTALDGYLAGRNYQKHKDAEIVKTCFVGWPMSGANQRGDCAAAILNQGDE